VAIAGNHARGLVAVTRICLPLIGLATACTTVQQGGSQTLLMKATHTKLTSSELRANTDTLADQVPALIEAGADEIIAKSSEPAVRRRAILWKSVTIPVFYEALFRSDPLVAALDSYVLSIQLEQSLETGPDRASFGAEQPLAVATARSVRSLIYDTIRAVARDPDNFQKATTRFEEFAKAHPIEGLISSRPSILPSLAELAGVGDTSVFEVVGSVDTTLTDLTHRINVYSAFVPKQVRWQVELMSYELADRAEFRDTLATFQAVHQFSDTANALFSPEGLRHSQAEFFEALEAERVLAMGGVDQQRVASLEYLTSERKAAFESISAERRAVFAELDREKVEVMNQIQDLRAQVIVDVNRAIDRAVWRIAELFAALLLAVTLLALWLLRVARRRKTLPGAP
jgi:hypothetical protein